MLRDYWMLFGQSLLAFAPLSTYVCRPFGAQTQWGTHIRTDLVLPMWVQSIVWLRIGTTGQWSSEASLTQQRNCWRDSMQWSKRTQWRSESLLLWCHGKQNATYNGFQCARRQYNGQRWQFDLCCLNACTQRQSKSGQLYQYIPIKRYLYGGFFHLRLHSSHLLSFSG